jgi:glutathione S-transferase
MLEVWSWPTPNGHKVHIALEELGLEYKVIPVDIGAGDQFKPEFLKITRNHRIPAIVDPDGPDGKPFTLFESAAILIYLSEKTGGKFIPKDPIGRYKCLEWMMFQMGGVGPMFGQWNHFGAYATERIPYAIERYTNEVKRLTRVLNHRLEEARWLATNTAWPTSSPSRGSAPPPRRACVSPSAAASASPTIRPSNVGTTKWRRARRCSAASRCWPSNSAISKSATPSAKTRSVNTVRGALGQISARAGGWRARRPAPALRVWPRRSADGCGRRDRSRSTQ